MHYISNCPVGWGCRIHRLQHFRWISPPPPMRVLDITLNNLMRKFEWCKSFGECRAPFHFHWSQVHSCRNGVRGDVVRKASTQWSERQGSGWAAMENEKNTTLTAINLGSKSFSYVQSPASSHTQTLSKPFRNLPNKVRGKILLLKKLSWVFIMRLSLSCVCLSSRRYVSRMYICIFLHESTDDNTT